MDLLRRRGWPVPAPAKGPHLGPPRPHSHRRGVREGLRAGVRSGRELTERARTGGLKLTGEGGLLGRLTKMVVEGALEGELDDHLGYGKHDPEGRDGSNSRNGHRSKTVLTDTGPVEISVLRDRDSSFEPKIVAKRQRRLTGVGRESVGSASGAASPTVIWRGRRVRSLGPGLTSESADAARAVLRNDLSAGSQFFWHPPALPV